MTMPATATFAEFAVLGGWKRGWVTQLRKDGRLVLTEDGKGVRVPESFQLIEETKDPSRAGVAARHAAGRAAATVPVAPQPPPEEEGEEDVPAAFQDSHTLRRARALADKEEALARKALREEQIEMGALLVADDVRAIAADAVVNLRTSLENMRDSLAPELAAANDEDRVRALVGDAVEHALEELSRRFLALGRAEG